MLCLSLGSDDKSGSDSGSGSDSDSEPDPRTDHKDSAPEPKSVARLGKRRSGKAAKRRSKKKAKASSGWLLLQSLTLC